MKKIILLFALTAIIFAGCNNKVEYPIDVKYNTIGQGTLTQWTDDLPKQNFVIKTQTEWDNLKAKMNNSENGDADFLNITNDFSENYIIAVFDEVRPTGGWSIDITKVIEEENEVIITASNLNTGDNTEGSILAFDIVKIPITDKPISFDIKYSNNNDDDPIYPITIEFTSIGHCSSFIYEGENIFSRENFIIKSQNEWDELKEKLNDPICETNEFLTIENDFSEYYFIAIFDEIKPTSGWSIDITEIIEYKEEVIVSGKNINTGDDIYGQTQPFHIVKIPATEKNISFEIEYTETTYPIKIDFITIGYCSSFSDIGETILPKESFVIKSQSDWDDLKGKLSDPLCETNEFLIIENNFSEYFFIAVFDDIRTTGGWSIDITDIIDYGTEIKVTGSNLNTGSDIPVQTQPFHIVKIPVVEKDVTFEIEYSDSYIVPDEPLLITTICWNNLIPDSVYLINSADELLMYACDDNIPLVNFDIYSIVLAYGNTTYGVHEITKELIFITENEYELFVDIHLNMTAIPEGWRVAILSQKISQDTSITLNKHEHF